jgi:hypothetical protein
MVIIGFIKQIVELKDQPVRAIKSIKGVAAKNIDQKISRGYCLKF